MSQIQCFTCQKKIDVRYNFLCKYCGSLPIHQTIDEAVVEMITHLGSLNAKIIDLRTFFKTLGLPTSDKRNQTLGALNFLFLRLSHQLLSFHEFITNPKDPLAQQLLQQNSRISQQSMDEFIATYDVLNIRDFLTGFLFIIEDFFKNVNKILKNQTYGKGYENLVRHLICELFNLKADSELYRTLYFPAIVRNSLHAGGINTDNNANGKIGEVFFRFEKDKPVSGSWRNIYFFCDKILDAIDQILRNKQIEKMPI